MSDEYISEDTLWDDWGVIQNDDGGMFDYDDVKDQPLEHVWTVVCWRRLKTDHLCRLKTDQGKEAEGRSLSCG